MAAVSSRRQPTSPHLLIPKMKARLYIGIAANDDMTQPTAKDTVKQAFADAKLPAEIEVYPTAQHGWCVPGHAAAGERHADLQQGSRRARVGQARGAV
jgi:carboxymethylenebutenolidase